MELIGWRGRNDIEAIGEKETIIRIYCMKKFNKNGIFYCICQFEAICEA